MAIYCQKYFLRPFKYDYAVLNIITLIYYNIIDRIIIFFNIFHQYAIYIMMSLSIFLLFECLDIGLVHDTSFKYVDPSYINYHITF
jgi:hypothetical protein